MTIRTRLIVQTVLLQVASLFLLAYGVLAVQSALSEREIADAELLLKHAVARTATDALIQKDEVQLLSYLNFLKVQYPALTHARVIWHKGERSSTLKLGAPPPGADAPESRVRVPDPSSAERGVEIFYGVDREVLRAPLNESRRENVKLMLRIGAGTALAGLLMAFLLARSLTRQLTALGGMAQQISEGRLGVHLEWESDDELGALVRVFNNMSARLAELDGAKKNFVSSVTHELRSPLGAIESFLPLIREKVLSGDKAALAQSLEYMDRIQANVHRLNRFITDLLDVAKIEQGKMECVLRPMRVGPIAREVVQFFEAKASAQGVSVETSVDGEASPVLGDADRVRQVLVNLVANALKFTPSGGRVWVAAEQVREDGQRWLEVTVGDTGRGMDEGDRRRVFQPFSQGRNVAEGVAGPKGTGLGLYIVRSIIEQHGGRVELKSAPGQGTRISFTLKLAS